jgi:hypothetical protein
MRNSGAVRDGRYRNKTPARRPAFRKLRYRLILVAVVVAKVLAIIIMVMIPAMFSADVVAVNPLMVVVGPMPLHPNHFIVARPIACAVAVIRPVTDLNAKALGSRGGRK